MKNAWLGENSIKTVFVGNNQFISSDEISIIVGMTLLYFFISLEENL